ncbi:MAG: hypothetical protein M3Y76_08140 [Chloroflexota bacterium]|nr:hypothetical protein [Chloroflexota bacterium]
MNITTGGPHILLFERDQQLVALLTSELQLAGYEYHTARTAVEVFDAIARHPVRLVLVNLAQAAAARREFWVALDTQRRGRGVQVLTFHCTNLAGYGPSSEDPDERSNSVVADMEVDGMLGIMNMVNAIRSRLAISNTGVMSRLATQTNPSSLGGQNTLPIPSTSPVNTNQASTSLPFNGTPSTQPSQLSQPSAPSPEPSAAASEFSRPTVPAHTDKIRAVIYPNQRSWSNMSSNNSADDSIGSNREQQPVQETAWVARGSQNAGSATNPVYISSAADTSANRQAPILRPTSETSYSNESSLAQLSRMLQEQHSSFQEEAAQEPDDEQRDRFQEETALQQPVRSDDAPSISTMTLRASPIQDMPIERADRPTGSGGQSDTSTYTGPRRYDEANRHNYAQPPASPPLMSIATPKAPASTSELGAQPAIKSSTAPIPTPQREESIWHNNRDARYSNTPFSVQELLPEPSSAEKDREQGRSAREDEQSFDNTTSRSVEHVQTNVPEDEEATISLEPPPRVPDNALLLDIVQSLPPMTSPPPLQQVLNGRATRSLGSVLLEGHLVPQNRLEVAHNIQRMLRGVDMDYQLGEILLMFKLLTPDQLLAASLVSYGLITTTQISALGRIRQELHAIGLEYDLENLLILFRILTSEQLREVRSNWT